MILSYKLKQIYNNKFYTTNCLETLHNEQCIPHYLS